MKKSFKYALEIGIMQKSLLIILLLLFVTKSYSQKNEGAAVAAGILAGALFTGLTIEAVKETLEQEAVEYIFSEYPKANAFQIKTSSLDGTKISDLSNVSAVSYEYIDLISSTKYILMAFTSKGWWNDNGVNYNRISWRRFDRDQWNSLIKAFLESTSKNVNITLEQIKNGKLDDSGFKSGKEMLVSYPRVNGDIYLAKDYDENIKVVFNEKSFNIFLKETRDLVKMKRSVVNKLHNFIN